MGFQTAQLAATRGSDVTVLGATVVTSATTVTSTGVDVGGAGTLRAQVAVSAISGAGATMTVTLQTSHDNGVADAWRTAGAAFAGLTTVTSSPFQTMVVDRYVRVSAVSSGTVTSITYTVTGEAV